MIYQTTKQPNQVEYHHVLRIDEHLYREMRTATYATADLPYKFLVRACAMISGQIRKMDVCHNIKNKNLDNNVSLEYYFKKSIVKD